MGLFKNNNVIYENTVRWDVTRLGPADLEYWSKPLPAVANVLEKWKTTKLKEGSPKVGLHKLLDLGTGTGRHAILAAQNGFDVRACDNLPANSAFVSELAKDNGQNIKSDYAKMFATPYHDGRFESIIAIQVLSLTNTYGLKSVIDEAYRILANGGEMFFTLDSKDSAAFKSKQNIKIDENSRQFMGAGPDRGLVRCFVDDRMIYNLMNGFVVLDQKKGTDQRGGAHYLILAKKDNSRRR